VARLDANGLELWRKLITAPDGYVGMPSSLGGVMAIAVGPEGEVVVSGGFSGSVSFGGEG
jgi:hypothetical protein